MIHFCTSVSNINKLVPTSGEGSDGFGFGIAVLWVMAARRSKTVKSMTVLMLSSGLFFGEGVGESGIIIGLVGEFGGVDSSEEGIWGISRMVRGIRMARGSVIPEMRMGSESTVWLD